MVWAWSAVAQPDTLQHLPEVEISASKLLRYSVGSPQYKLDSTSQSHFSTRHLGQLLTAHTPIYFKTYGNGMLATPAFRGTGAMHTAVLWNGFPTASPALGQVDFSQLPVFAQDEVRVQHGANSALFGSGAIGGSVHLGGEAPDFRKGSSGRFWQESSSLDSRSPWMPSQFSAGGSWQTGTRHWQSRTRAYGLLSDNRFRYRHPRGYTDRQEQAAFAYGGLMQDVFLRPSPNERIAIQGWYHYSDQELQSTLGDASPPDLFTQSNLRLTARYQHPQWQIAGAYFRDMTLFDENDRTLTHRWMSEIQRETNFGEQLSLQAGARWIHFRTQVDNYEGTPTENRWALFGLLRYEPFRWWTLSLNLRQELAAGYEAPLTPALGSRWQLVQNQAHNLSLRTSLSRSFRLPTLNERYWQPGGNPELAPERGYSAELGVDYRYQATSWQADFGATAFRNQLNGWVLWLPQGGVWSPRNVQEVQADGLELSTEIAAHTRWGNWQLSGQYSYTATRYASGEFSGNQLPYTPLHLANLNLRWQYQSWQASATQQWTCSRYLAQDNKAQLDGFSLLELRAGKQFALPKAQFQVGIRVENVLNVSYQNLSNRAMPLRTYHLSVGYQVR